MELINSSTEHYFLARLDELKQAPKHWYGLYFSLSKTLPHGELMGSLKEMNTKIEQARAKRDVFAEELQVALKDGFEGSICVFADLDIFVLAKATDEKSVLALQNIFKSMNSKMPKGVSDMDTLSSQLRSYSKLADEKLLSAKRFDAYISMMDKHKVSSITARRKRRDAPLVMVVEDDRFTAHYAANVLSSDFDLVVCKDGEEAIEAYIENAPDIVFLDIHLPGLSGHDVLQSIYAVDSKAFVVMLSVDSVKENIVAASKLGARKFLKKPFTKERLVETVKSSPYVRGMMRSDTSESDSVFH